MGTEFSRRDPKPLKVLHFYGQRKYENKTKKSKTRGLQQYN